MKSDGLKKSQTEGSTSVVETPPAVDISDTSSSIMGQDPTDHPDLRTKLAHTPKFMLFSAAIACLGSFNNGYNTSVFNIPENVIRFCQGVEPPDRKHGGLPDCIPMGNFDWGLAVAMFAVGGLFGGLLGGPGISRLGRRGAMIWNNLFLIIGSLLVSTTTSTAQMVIGRFIVGIGCGGACVITPTYLSEISTVQARGALGAMNQLGIVLGILVVEVLGLGLSTPPLWRLLTALSAVIAAIQMGCCLLIDETPRYLVLQGKVAEAELALRRLRGSNDVGEELEEIINPKPTDDTEFLPVTTEDGNDAAVATRLSSAEGNEKDPDKKELKADQGDANVTTNRSATKKDTSITGTPKSPHHGRRSGADGASSDTSDDMGAVFVPHHRRLDSDEIAEAAGGPGGRVGVRDPESPAEIMADGGQPAINVWQLLRGRTGSYRLMKPLIFASAFSAVQQLSGINGVMFYSTSIFDKLFSNKQTPQHITVGTGGLNVIMTIITLGLVDRLGRKVLTLTSAFGMTVASILIVVASAANIDVLVIVCVFLFIAFFAVGLGVTPWLVMTESFPTYAQSAASSWCMILNWFCNFIIGLIFPSLQAGLKDATFVPFAVITGAFAVFVLLFVPETKGRTVDEIVTICNQSDFGRAKDLTVRCGRWVASCGGLRRSGMTRRAPAAEDLTGIRTPASLRSLA